MIAGTAVQAAPMRGCQLRAAGIFLELRLNDLFGVVGSNLDHALVVLFPCARDPKNMLAWRNGGENNAPRSAHAALPFVIDINLSPGGSENHQSRFSLGTLRVLLPDGVVQLLEPFDGAGRTFAHFSGEPAHNRSFHISGNVRAQRGQWRWRLCKFLRD